MKIFLLIGALVVSHLAYAVDLGEIEKKLAAAGVEGEVHGASVSQGIYVFTYRNPQDFFDFVELSLVSESPAIQAQLGTLARHDRIRVKGSFLPNRSPQKHVLVSSIEMVRKFVSPFPVDPYGYEAKLPDELLNKTSAKFMIHAVHGQGQILVAEYKDAVVPIFVHNGALTQDLFRGDVVELKFRVAQEPGHPTHLRLNETDAQPVKILEAIRAKHGKGGVVEGALILFPKSPEIRFNVFAVQERLAEGLSRQYTLVNFDSPDAFAKIREKLQAAWDQHPGAYVNGRNKLVSTVVRVRAKGVFNEIDPNQANPQILLASPESIEILP